MRIGWHTQRPNPKHASARLRVHGPMALLEARGHECVFYDGAQKPDGLDCIVISKSFTSTAHRVLDRAEAAGVPVLYDMCDNLVAKAWAEGDDEAERRVVSALGRAARITAPTAELLDRLSEQVPGVRSREDLDAGRFDNPCPVCGGPLAWALVDEDARLEPRSGYAASKVAQEHYATAWVRQADAAAVSLRYHNVYGPGMPRDTPYSGVAAMFRSSLERGEAPTVYEDGEQMRDFVHVTDVARANLASLDAVLEAPAGHHRAYNVASGHPVGIRRVAELVAEGTGRDLAPEVTGGYRLGDVRHIVASPERARAELGFSAEVLPDVGLPAFATAPLRA